MRRTTSETIFEKFCIAKGIVCERIPESEVRTPDYEVVCGHERIVVEVKEIHPNEQELEADRILRERGVGPAMGHTPGDRLRLKIAACSEQIKARTGGTRPSLLVVFDQGREIPHLESYAVRVAMYGLEQIHITVPPPGAGSPYPSSMSYGPKRKMTPDHNTSISAIGALVMAGPDDVLLLVYHNRFAKVPLTPALLGQYGIRQWKLEDETAGRIAQWREIMSS